MAQTRNWRFDFLKAISCLTVILLHIRLPGVVGDLIIYAFRFPVPLFFMISGYYGYGRDDRWLIKKALETLRLLVFTELFYGLWTVLTEDPVKYWLMFTAHPIRVLVRGCLFNNTLWYLTATVWSYLFLVLLRKVNVYRWAWWLIGVLLTVQVAGRFYVQNHYDIDELIYLFRTAAFMGLPLMLVGAKLAEHEAQIKRRFTALTSFGVMAVGGAVMVGEYLLSGQYMDFHFSTLIISVGMFLFAMTHQGKQNAFFAGMSYLGRSLSAWVYLAHIWVGRVLTLLAMSLGFVQNPLWQYAMPLLACALSCAVAQGVAMVYKKK